MGKVSVKEVDAPYGTEIKVSGNSVAIGNQTITATPTANNAQYTYSFDGWVNATSAVKGDITITANFSRVINKYTVTYKDSNDNILGTEEVEYGTKVGELNAPIKDGYEVSEIIGIDAVNGVIGDVGAIVKYDLIVKTNDTLSNNLTSIVSDQFAAELIEDDIKVTFENTNTSLIGVVDEVMELLDVLTGDESYDTVVLSYGSKTLNISSLDYNNMSNDELTEVARFLALIGTGSYSGSKVLTMKTGDLVGKTVGVTLTLKDGFVDANGKNILNYDLMFMS